MWNGIGIHSPSQAACGGYSSGQFRATQLAGCILWLRADLGIGLSGADAATWADQSGNGNSATTPGNKPAWEAAGWSNGLPTVTFVAASTEYMSLGAMTDASNDYTLFAALNQVSAATSQALIGTGNTHSFWLAREPAVISVGINDGADRKVAASTTGEQLLTWHLDKTGNLVTCYRNGVSLGTAVYGNPWSWTTPMIGRRGGAASWYPNVKVAELVLYNRLLTAAELATVHAALQARYGL